MKNDKLLFTGLIALLALTLISMRTKLEWHHQSNLSINEKEYTPDNSFLISSAESPIAIQMGCLGLNEFEVALTDYDESTTLKFVPPIQLKIWINNEATILYDSDSIEVTTIELSNESFHLFTVDETSMPTSSSGVYPLRIASISSGHIGLKKEINVQIGCTDSRKSDYMGCVLHCEKWGVRW